MPDTLRLSFRECYDFALNFFSIRALCVFSLLRGVIVRVLLFFVVALTVLSNDSIPKQPTKTSHPEHSNTQAPDDVRQPTTQVVNIKQGSDARHDEKTGYRQGADHQSQQWWQRPSITDWVLAVTTMAYVIVNVFVLFAIKRQAEIAKLNTESLINTDRPWVVVLLVQNPKRDLRFKASNEGRSPAKIIQCFAQCGFVSGTGELPLPPKYGIALPNSAPLLMPNIGHDLSGQLISLKDYDFGHLMQNDPQRALSIQQGTSHLVFWFRILYTTQTAIQAKIAPYETRCCYSYGILAADELKPFGPDEYTQYD